MEKGFLRIDGKIPYYISPLFESFGIRHAFFTRVGGVSEGPFDSLNFAVGAGEQRDDPDRVIGNYSLAASVFGLKKTDICRSYQTHTSFVLTVDETHKGIGISRPPFDFGVDGLVTEKKDLLLSVRTADCVPVLLSDKQKTVCAAVHAGWRGTLGGITLEAIRQMERLGANRSNIVAAIGPCIGQCCYEVGGEVYDAFVGINGGYGRFFTPCGDKYFLDLTGLNAFMLTSFGIGDDSVSVYDGCTKCNEKEFFSHRRNGVNRGTMGSFICL